MPPLLLTLYTLQVKLQVKSGTACLDRVSVSLGLGQSRPSAAPGRFQISPAKSTLLLFGHALTPSPSIMIVGAGGGGRGTGTRELAFEQKPTFIPVVQEVSLLKAGWEATRPH